MSEFERGGIPPGAAEGAERKLEQKRLVAEHAAESVRTPEEVAEMVTRLTAERTKVKAGIMEIRGLSRDMAAAQERGDAGAMDDIRRRWDELSPREERGEGPRTGDALLKELERVNTSISGAIASEYPQGTSEELLDAMEALDTRENEATDAFRAYEGGRRDPQKEKLRERIGDIRGARFIVKTLYESRQAE